MLISKGVPIVKFITPIRTTGGLSMKCRYGQAVHFHCWCCTRIVVFFLFVCFVASGEVGGWVGGT